MGPVGAKLICDSMGSLWRLVLVLAVALELHQGSVQVIESC